jgi:hypothetical protein
MGPINIGADPYLADSVYCNGNECCEALYWANSKTFRSRNYHLLAKVMSLSIPYILVYCMGATSGREPFLKGEGSVQLTSLYQLA